MGATTASLHPKKLQDPARLSPPLPYDTLTSLVGLKGAFQNMTPTKRHIHAVRRVMWCSGSAGRNARKVNTVPCLTPDTKPHEESHLKPLTWPLKKKITPAQSPPPSLPSGLNVIAWHTLPCSGLNFSSYTPSPPEVFPVT
ncbi:hypothetical protein E2C01_041208 [Portunus trituberculatus]|uniref:Uncharacterized protein n=1 Tax=Portunus trituberculatus TaxID=210409 RepID=A0A5B7FJE9_PORTR|nr:hypothetical protein [Portunus trituberculatus]